MNKSALGDMNPYPFLLSPCLRGKYRSSPIMTSAKNPAINPAPRDPHPAPPDSPDPEPLPAEPAPESSSEPESPSSPTPCDPTPARGLLSLSLSNNPAPCPRDPVVKFVKAPNEANSAATPTKPALLKNLSTEKRVPSPPSIKRSRNMGKPKTVQADGS